MNTDSIKITKFINEKHRDSVIDLWQKVFDYQAPHNDPGLTIDKKIEVDDGLFFVAFSRETLAGSVMAGYDGHRGWIYSLAVEPALQNQQIGSKLMRFVETTLSELGCLKVNLQLMDGNEAVEKFYLKQGYFTEQRISLGKLLNRS